MREITGKIVLKASISYTIPWDHVETFDLKVRSRSLGLVGEPSPPWDCQIDRNNPKQHVIPNSDSAFVLGRCLKGGYYGWPTGDQVSDWKDANWEHPHHYWSIYPYSVGTEQNSKFRTADNNRPSLPIFILFTHLKWLTNTKTQVKHCIM